MNVVIPHYHMHMLLAYYRYIQMLLTKVASKDQFKSAFLVFKKMAYVTFLGAV